MRRGDVLRYRPGRRSGHEVKGPRYAVVLSSDELTALSTVIVAPTSASARAASFRPEVRIGRRPTRVLVEQLGSVDATRLGDRVGRLTAGDLAAIDDALFVVLGLG